MPHVGLDNERFTVDDGYMMRRSVELLRVNTAIISNGFDLMIIKIGFINSQIQNQAPLHPTHLQFGHLPKK